MKRWIVLGTVAGALLWPNRAVGLSLIGYRDAEIIDKSEEVLRGKVIKVISPAGADRVEGFAASVATVEVAESFKGKLKPGEQIEIVYWSHDPKQLDQWARPNRYEVGQVFMLALQPKVGEPFKNYLAPPEARTAKWICRWRTHYDHQLQSKTFLEAARIYRNPSDGLRSREKGARLASIYWLSLKQRSDPSAELLAAIKSDLNQTDKDLVRNALDAIGRLKAAALVPDALQLVKTGHTWGWGWTRSVSRTLVAVGEPAVEPLIKEAQANTDGRFDAIFLNCMGELNGDQKEKGMPVNKMLEQHLMGVVRDPTAGVDSINYAVSALRPESIQKEAAIILRAVGRTDFREGTGYPYEAAYQVAIYMPKALWKAVDEGDEVTAERAAWALYRRFQSNEAIPERVRASVYQQVDERRRSGKEAARVFIPRLIRKYSD